MGVRYSDDDPIFWTYEDVEKWLKSIKMEKYAKLLTQDHKCLLSITDADLKNPPVSINCLGDIKQILFGIEALTAKSRAQTDLLVEFNESNRVSISGEDILTMTRKAEVVSDQDSLLQTLSRSVDGLSTVQLISRDEIIRHVESPDTLNKSLVKLFISFLYSLTSFLITAFVMVLVHDRVPDTKLYPPLPDIVLDNVPHIPWAFDMCEVIGMVLSVIWITILFFHKERIVIARRMFSLLGTVFLLRCFTMVITSLSVPGIHLQCEARPNTTMSEKVTQALHIWSNLGLSLHGVRSCGDYMFSGHTTVITMISHFITEYTPSSWTGLHTITWVLNCFAIFLILAAHEHYSIDVFIAFYISSRMFLYYHAYAYNHANITANDDRMRVWFPLGWFFEYGSVGKVENEYSIPIPIPNGRKVEELPQVFSKPPNRKGKSGKSKKNK